MDGVPAHWDDWTPTFALLGRSGTYLYTRDRDCWSYVTAVLRNGQAINREGLVTLAVTRSTWLETTGWRGRLAIALDVLRQRRLSVWLFGKLWHKELNLQPPGVAGGYVLEEGP